MLFGEHIKEPGFWPQFTCLACKNQFEGRYSGGGRSKSRNQYEVFSCSRCPNALILSFTGEFFNGYDLDFKKFGNDIYGIISENLKPCPCGGTFQLTYESRCPRCCQQMGGDALLAYPIINDLTEEAFIDKLDYARYIEEVKKRSSINKTTRFRNTVNVALEYQSSGKLRDIQDDIKEAIRREYLPLESAKVFFAHKWIIDNPKKNLFELYISKLYQQTDENGSNIQDVLAQYTAAHNISILAGQPFEMVPLTSKDADRKFKQLFSLPSAIKDFFKARKVHDLREQGHDAAAADKLKEMNLPGQVEKLEKWYDLNKNEIEIPWRVEAEKQINKWRKWWEENKSDLPV